MNDAEPTAAAAKADTRYSSRKFLLALLALIAAGAANVLRIPIDPAVADLVKWTIALYFAGNVGASAVALLAGKVAK